MDEKSYADKLAILEKSYGDKVSGLENIFNEVSKHMSENVNEKAAIKRYCSGKSRTVKIVIEGMTAKGFSLSEDGVVPSDELEDPNVTITINEDAFISFVVGDTNFDDLQYIFTRITGDRVLGGVDIFRLLFEGFKELWEKRKRDVAD